MCQSSQESQAEMIGNTMRTAGVTISKRYGPNVSVQNGDQRESDAARISKKDKLWTTDRRLRKKQVATAARRRWMCHTRGVACWRCSAERCALCMLTVLMRGQKQMKCYLVREKNTASHRETTGVCLIHPRGRNSSRACHAWHAARIASKSRLQQ